MGEGRWKTRGRGIRRGEEGRKKRGTREQDEDRIVRKGGEEKKKRGAIRGGEGIEVKERGREGMMKEDLRK